MDFFICIILNIFLVLYGLWLIPAALKASANGVSGFIASLAILIVYLCVFCFLYKANRKV